jgi:hypothetical protein
MKNKFLLTLSVLSTAVVLSACGSNTSGVSVENTETEIVASVDTETETTEETTETEEIESTEIADTEVESTQTVDTENETETEAVASGEFTDTYEDTRPADEVTYETSDGYDIWQNTVYGEYGETSENQAYANWSDYAKENGADGVWGYYWYYEKGSAAGDKGSYLVYMKEGSPYYGQVFQYGDTLLDGSINKRGTNDEYYGYIDNNLIEDAKDEGILETDENGNTIIDLDKYLEENQ